MTWMRHEAAHTLSTKPAASMPRGLNWVQPLPFFSQLVIQSRLVSIQGRSQQRDPIQKKYFLQTDEVKKDRPIATYMFE